MNICLNPVGHVRSTRAQLEDDHWDAVESHVELETRFNPSALEGLVDFSHVEIVFFMDRVETSKIETGARHPRNNPNWEKVGIFAQRGKNRPNQIGTTICQIKRVDGNKLYLTGLDALDGTPVLDIKPWVQEFGPRVPIRQPNWISDLMSNYWS